MNAYDNHLEYFGELFSKKQLEFWAAMAFGTAATMLFSGVKFRTPVNKEGSSVEQKLAPSDSTSQSRYTIALFTYGFGLLVAYWGICYIGPVPLAQAGILDDLPRPLDHDAAIPLVALVLLLGLGAVPNRYLSGAEQYWRSSMHDWARIPRAVRLFAVQFASSPYLREEIFVRRVRLLENLDAAVPASFLSQPPTSAEYRLGRIAALLGTIVDLKSSYVEDPRIDQSAFNRFRDEFDQIFVRNQQLIKKIATADRNQAEPELVEVPSAYLPEIEEIIRDASTLISLTCRRATNTTKNSHSLLRFLGFKGADASHSTVDADIFFISVPAAILAYVAWILVGPGFHHFFSSNLLQGWPDPSVGYERSVYLLPFLSAHFLAVVVFMGLRRRRLNGSAWFESDGQAMPRISSYGVLGLASYLAATLALWAAYASFNIKLPWVELLVISITPAASAIFFSIGVDAARIGKLPHYRARIASAHTLIIFLLYMLGVYSLYPFDFAPGAKLFSAIAISVYVTTLAGIVASFRVRRP